MTLNVADLKNIIQNGLKVKKLPQILKNKNCKCFQSPLTDGLNHKEISTNPERVTNIEKIQITVFGKILSFQ